MSNPTGEVAAKTPWVDSVMFRYNFRQYGNKELNKAMDACVKAGVGFEMPISDKVTLGAEYLAMANAAGISPDVILRLANDIFGWHIDFALEIQPGDRFSVIYEANQSQIRDPDLIYPGQIFTVPQVN